MSPKPLAGLAADSFALADAQAEGARQVLKAIEHAPEGLEWLRANSVVVRLEMEAAKRRQLAMEEELAASTKRIHRIKIIHHAGGPPWAGQA